MMLRWSSRTPRSSSSLSSVSVTSSVGLMSSSPRWCYENRKKNIESIISYVFSIKKKRWKGFTVFSGVSCKCINVLEAAK